MNKFKYLLTIILTGLCVFGISLYMIFAPKKDYSNTERRSLKKCPKPAAAEISNGKFMTDFDDFALDQFPLRDTFRTVTAKTSKYVLQKKDNHNLYLKNGYISKLVYPLETDKLEKRLNQLSKNVYEKYLKDTDCKIYLSIIPDKNYFLAENDYLTVDYSDFTEKVKDKLNFAEYIDIFDLLTLESYYKTDQHWKQESLIPVAKKINAFMNPDVKFDGDFTQRKLTIPFYGAYYGQATFNLPPDEINYLEKSDFQQVEVISYNTGKPKPSSIYDMKKAEGRDPYEMYLGGSDALLEINNPSSLTDKELIVFRDSFGSSLIPLLIPEYQKITLVDLRYIQPELLKKFIEFKNKDILILYSTLILNS
ncbi:MAG: DHHW family protein [Treponema sp.]|nr:DHHW family protein [Treponema sp.]